MVITEEQRAALTAALNVLDTIAEDGSTQGACPIHGLADFRAIRSIAMMLQGRNETATCLCDHSLDSLISPGECKVIFDDRMARQNRLLNAIRRYTFDAENDKPNGPTEEAMDDMLSVVEDLGRIFRQSKQRDPPQGQIGRDLDSAVARVSECAARWCESSIDDSTELLEAAQAIFPQDLKGEVSPVTTRSVVLGKALFSFISYDCWRENGQSWYANTPLKLHETIALDSQGRVVVLGKQFHRARDEKSFPVTVYPIDNEIEWGRRK